MNNLNQLTQNEKREVLKAIASGSLNLKTIKELDLRLFSLPVKMPLFVNHNTLTETYFLCNQALTENQLNTIVSYYEKRDGVKPSVLIAESTYNGNPDICSRIKN